MLRYVTALPVFCLLVSARLHAAEIKGQVLDPSGAPVAGAQVAAVNRVGIVARATAGATGTFQLELQPDPDIRIVVTAPGFSTRTLTPAQVSTIRLEIAPQVDSIQVVDSTIEIPATLQSASVNVIESAEVRRRNEPFAMDLLRYVPGLAFNQSGAAGGVSSLFLRGGNANMNLVEIDGVPV